MLNRQLAAVRDQLAKLSAALDVANANVKDKDRKIAELGAELNLALANKACGELEKYRSEFFGKLRIALGNRADIRIVGDRFVVPTDILFDSASAELNPSAQLSSLTKLAQTLNEMSLPRFHHRAWTGCCGIDGLRPTGARSTRRSFRRTGSCRPQPRAVAIVKYLVVQGIPAPHLSANGFGQFQPLDPADTEGAYAKNRRIEIQLTNR